MMATNDVVFLLDVDSTLLDNDRVHDDLRNHLEGEFGAASRDRYSTVFEALRAELDNVDYLGALQRYPARHYLMVDDKLRIFDATKRVWEDRLTTNGLITR